MAQPVVGVEISINDKTGQQPGSFVRPQPAGGAPAGDTGGGGAGQPSIPTGAAEDTGGSQGGAAGEAQGGLMEGLLKAGKRMIGRRFPGGFGALGDIVGGLTGGGGMGGGGAGGMLSGLGGAAGAVAPILLGATVFTEAMDMAAGGVRKFGEVASAAAQNEYWATFRGAAQGVTDFIDSMGLAGEVVTALPKVFLAVADASKMLVDSFIARARQLEDMSPDISLAFAQADIRRFFMDFKEAQRLGPGMSRLIDKQSRIEDNLQETFMEAKVGLIEKLDQILEIAVIATDFLRTNKEGISAGAKATWELTKIISPIVMWSDLIVTNGPAIRKFFESAGLIKPGDHNTPLDTIVEEMFKKVKVHFEGTPGGGPSAYEQAGNYLFNEAAVRKSEGIKIHQPLFGP